MDVKSSLNILGLSCTKRFLGINNTDTTITNGTVASPVDIITNAENIMEVDCNGAELVELRFYINNEKIYNIKFEDSNSAGFVHYDGELDNSADTTFKDGDDEEDNKVTMKIANPNQENKIDVIFVLPSSVKTILYNKSGNLINNTLGYSFFEVKGNLKNMLDANNMR